MNGMTLAYAGLMFKRSLIFTLAVALGAFFYFENRDPHMPSLSQENSMAAVESAAPVSVKGVQQELAFQPEIARTLHEMASASGTVDFSTRDRELRQMAARFSEEDFARLAITLGRTELANDERRAGLYFLSVAGPAAIHALGVVAAKPVPELANSLDPHSSGAVQKSIEVALRTQALQSLDAMAADSVQVREELEKVLSQQTDPTVKFFAQVSLQGIQQGRPGKLQRLAERVLRTGE